MNIFHLQCFQMVARENHMTRAAEKMNIAQPALSGIISKMENDFGVPLFDRVGRQIQLNENGRALLEHVDLILSEWDKACAELNQVKNDSETVVRIGVTGQLFPQQIIMSYKMKKPAILVKQSLIKTSDILPDLTGGKYDLIISTLPLDAPNLVCTPFFREEVYLLVNRKHPLADQASVSLADLDDLDMIALPEGYAFRDILDGLFSAAHVRFNVVYESFPSQFGELVSRDIGSAFVTESTVRENDYPPDTVSVPISPSLYRNLYILQRKNALLSNAAQSFLDYVLHFYTDREER